MTSFTLRPDFRTSGGESSDIMWNNRYVGSMTLLYREQERITGSVQLEKESLSPADKAEVIDHVRGHIQALIDAVRARECDILVTYGTYDHVISTPTLEEEEFDGDWAEEEDDTYGDYDPNDQESIEMEQSWDEDDECGRKWGIPVVYELVVVNETRSGIEYHIYDQTGSWIAEASMRWNGADVTGEIDWVIEPSEDEIESLTDLVVSDFDENEVDTFQLDHRCEGAVVETIELTHEDLLEAGNAVYREPLGADEDDYTIVLARDDGDTLTYEIYKQSLGGLPIGTATVDISRRELTGYIDFREKEGADESERVAELLMRELDKEKDYETFSLTMLYRNEPIDEIIFETEHVH